MRMLDESDPNYDAYLWARQERITSGWVDGKFHAEARLSNASAAALLYRADGAQKIQMSGSSPFSDVSSATPFYRQIVWRLAVVCRRCLRVMLLSRRLRPLVVVLR